MKTGISRREVVKASVCAIGLGAGWGARASSPGGCDGDGGVAGEQPVVRNLRMRWQLHNPHSSAVEGVGFWAYLPMDHVEQRLASVRGSPPCQVSMDAMGHQVLLVQTARLAAYATALIQVDMTVTKSGNVCERARDPHSDSWLGSEPLVESDHVSIRELAQSLRGGDELQTAWAVYQWVGKELHYEGYVAQDKGALYAITERRGDCTEYAALVVALMRANGIPARVAGGHVLERDGLLKAVDYHNWAEVLLQGRWQIVDAQKQAWLAPRARYFPFEIYTHSAANALKGAHRYRVEPDVEVRF